MPAILREPTRQQSLQQVQRSPGPAPVRVRVCFVGLGNLPVLAREYNNHAIGGEQVQQTLLAKALARKGYEVTMVTADYGQPDGGNWQGVTVYKAYAWDAGLPILRFIYPRWSGMWSALKRADADVYYVSCASALVGQVALFCRRHSRRFIYRVASDVDCAPDTVLVKYWRDRRLYEYGLRRAHAVLVQSMHQRQLLKRNYGVSGSVAGMLVEPANADVTFSRRDLTALWINNLRSLKRPDRFFALADALPQLSFHMAGGALPGLEEFFAQANAEARSRANVSFLGHIPYHDVNAMYGRARVLVNTSDIEGFPNSYLQAWAAGTPVVAFFDPDGLIAQEGLGFAVRTQQELAEAVQALAADETAWRAASERCSAFMSRAYAEDAVLASYRALIDQPAIGSRP